MLSGCGGGGGNDPEWDFFDRAAEAIPAYESNPAREYWELSAPMVGDDDGDYSFIARFIVTISNNEIRGFGNANGYFLGSFFLTGTREGDNVEFEIVAQNRYRAVELTGKGIYVNGDTRIGGNSLEGRDYTTAFDDPVEYSGNFAVNVGELSAPKANGIYDGKLEGAYQSIENGTITFQANLEGNKVKITGFAGNLVGESQTEGSFNYDDNEAFTEVDIKFNKFTMSAGIDQDTIQVKGAITKDVASGFVIIQRSGRTYIGAFSAPLDI